MRNQVDNSRNQDKDKGSIFETRGGYRGGRFGVGRKIGGFRGRCFHCNEVGHQSFKCPKWIDLDKGKERRVNLSNEEK